MMLYSVVEEIFRPFTQVKYATVPTLHYENTPLHENVLHLKPYISNSRLYKYHHHNVLKVLKVKNSHIVVKCPCQCFKTI